MVRRREAPADVEDDGAAVRGPTSALTSFLRGQGIISRPRQIQQQREEREQAEQLLQRSPIASTSAASLPGLNSRANSLEAEFANEATTTSKKRKHPRKDEADDGWELDFAAGRKGRYDNRTPGAITLCTQCGKKFTVTKYTLSLPAGAGLVCVPCEKELGADGSVESHSAKKQRKTAKAKAAPIEKIKIHIDTLQESCIKIIGQCIDDLEEDSLGDVGSANMEKICKIVCKNRSLTTQTLKLFLDVRQEDLKLFDCSRIDERGYMTLCNLAPTLRSLVLRYCGTIEDGIMDLFQTKLVHLQRLELYGPFLVRAQKWIDYFDSLVGRHFEAFRLQQCPRFEMSCLQRLVESVPSLVDLQLADLVKLDDHGLRHMQALTCLRHLDISRAGKDGTALTDGGVIPLLAAIGHDLQTLVLDLNEMLSDRTLIEGILPHCHHLSSLSIRNLPNILSTGVEALFSGWSHNAPLRQINLSRLIDVDDDALIAVLTHSAANLHHLDLNSCDNITETGLNHLASTARSIRRLDISFVRAADDFVIKSLLDNMPDLRIVNVFGNNRVTDTCPRKQGVSIRGQEGQFEIVNWT